MENKNQPARILYVENGIGYGGAVICLRHLVRNLDKTKYLPMVVTGRTAPQYQEIAGEARWKHIPDRRIDIPALQRSLTKKRWLYNIPPLRFLYQQFLARLDDICNFLPFFLQLLWTSWRFKADLIHANNEPLCNRAALLVARCLRIPSVCHVRGDQNGSRLMRWAYNLPDHFISVSSWIANSMQQNVNIPKEKISVIYDGIALEKLETNIDGKKFRHRFEISDEDFTVGLVGLLIPWKGQNLFIDAAKILNGKIRNLKMLIIGGTPEECKEYEQELKLRVIKEELSDLVKFTGHIDDMQQVYNGLDIVVSASTSPEPLGTVVIETMAIGRPLIAPNHGGASEMVADNETGLLFSPGDADSLAQSILNFYESNTLMHRLGQAAREKALQTFSVKTHARAVEQVYCNLLSKTACSIS
ncbi:glycosyltransferase family 4 protein [Methylomonas sp. MgM2]